MTVTIRGVEPILRDLRRISLATVEDAVDVVMEAIGKDAAVYPPPRPNQRYVRTYTLRDGWLDGRPVIVTGGDTLVATLTNSTPYGADVMGPNDQAEIHRGRWRTTDQIAESWEARVAEQIERALVSR